MESGMRSKRRLLVVFGAVVLGAVFVYYLSDLGVNPPGFFLDESFIAYNAHVMSQTGHGEYGDLLPLFFPAFHREDYTFVAYANPVYIYVLALVFVVAPPSVVAAKALSAMLVFAACVGLGWLAYRMSDSVLAGFFIAVSAALTPWFFELSRLVFEVTAYPLCLLLFLLAVYRAWRSDNWNLLNSVLIAGGLALVTYSYTIGRLVGPILAAGLSVFYERRRLWPLVSTCALYTVSLLPMLVFAMRRPGAMTGRFNEVSTLGENVGGLSQTLLTFLSSYLTDIGPDSLLFVGDKLERHHIPVMGMILVVTFGLAVAGVIIILKRHTDDRWYLYLLYGLVVSPIPAALTNDRSHMLRLATLPVFVFLVSVPALKLLIEYATRRKAGRVWANAALAAIILSIVFQAYWFHGRYGEFKESRGYLFDAAYTSVFSRAISEPSRPIYLEQPDNYPAYIHARWYGATKGIEPIAFAKLEPGERPPPDSVVISMSDNCKDCRILKREGSFMVYQTEKVPSK